MPVEAMDSWDASSTVRLERFLGGENIEIENVYSWGVNVTLDVETLHTLIYRYANCEVWRMHRLIDANMPYIILGCFAGSMSARAIARMRITSGPRGTGGSITPARLPSNNSQLNHIFGNRPGHLPDTPANRQLLINTTGNRNNLLGTDQFGNKWFATTRSDGSQVWVQTRNGVIQNGGLNNPPISWDPNTGLSGPR